MTAVIKLNPDLIWVDLAKFSELGELPLAFFKYKSVQYAQENVPKAIEPILAKMLELMPVDKTMRLVVDYKVRDLRAGDCGCPLEGWHIDCVTNPQHRSKPETHLIFTSCFGTEFITTPMKVEQDDIHFSTVLSRHQEFDYIQVEPNTITGYSRFNLHRGPLVKEDCRRAVLRLTQTEVIQY